MGELADEWSTHERRNCGAKSRDRDAVGGAAGALHGALAAGFIGVLPCCEG
jgi:hypothetical protein